MPVVTRSQTRQKHFNYETFEIMRISTNWVDKIDEIALKAELEKDSEYLYGPWLTLEDICLHDGNIELYVNFATFLRFTQNGFLFEGFCVSDSKTFIDGKYVNLSPREKLQIEKIIFNHVFQFSHLTGKYINLSR